MKHFLQLFILYIAFGILVTCTKDEPGSTPVARFTAFITNVEVGESIQLLTSAPTHQPVGCGTLEMVQPALYRIQPNRIIQQVLILLL